MKIKKIIIAILGILLIVSSIELSAIIKSNNLLKEATENALAKEALLEETKKKHPFKTADKDTYEKEVEEIAKENEVVGLSIIVFHNEDILENFNYGYADKENNIKANEDTKYRIASISKVITTIGLMKLYDEGLFKLDDKISDVIDVKAYDDVTFKNLLTHTSGLSDSYVYNLAANGARYSLDYVVANSFYTSQRGTSYEYTNFGMSSVGGIIEHLTNEYFIDYMQDIFNDLDIDASFVAEYIKDQDNIAKLYDTDGDINDPKTWFKTSEFFKSYGLGNSYLSGAGDLIISAKDLAKFAMALSNEGIYNDKQILSSEAVSLMLNDNFDYYDYEGNYKYTEGLSCHNFKEMIKDRQIHGHTGSAYGVKTAMYFDPSDNTGVIILDNGANTHNNEEGYNSLLYDIATLTYKTFFTYRETNQQ